MDDFLTPVKTITKSSKTKIDIVISATQEGPRASSINIATLEDVLQTLRAEPDITTIRQALKYLAKAHKAGGDEFHIKVPSPLSAQIINILVNTTIPDYWSTFEKSEKTQQDRLLLIECLSSVSGLGAILARLKTLVAECGHKKTPPQKNGAPHHIRDLLVILTRILQGVRFADCVWTDISTLMNEPARRTLLWREFVSIVASGRTISIAAQAEDFLKSSAETVPENWLAKGSGYSKWLASNIAAMARTADTTDAKKWTAVAQLCGKAFGLGYTENIVAGLLQRLPLADVEQMPKLVQLVKTLQLHEQRQLLDATMFVLGTQYLVHNHAVGDMTTLHTTSMELGGCAALLSGLMSGNEHMKDSLVAWLTRGVANERIDTRRAALVVLSDDEDRMQKVMEKSIQEFNDQLYIKHTPIFQQEVTAQTLLMSCGYVHRSQPMYLFMVARSSTHTNGISNRLAASSPRARFLGMVVGMAISELIDKPENRMKFDNDEMETPEAKWYRDLVYVNDHVGKLDDLQASGKAKAGVKPVRPKKPSSDATTSASNLKHGTPIGQKVSQIPDSLRIVEIESDAEEDDLIPYAKPDSDPEDEDEDPTLVQRNKPTAPVYIRDLLAGLRDSESYDRHILALSTAASLIRRKSNFGKEVADHIEELASVLVGLNNHFELDNFDDLRQQALIAVLLAQPARMGQWFARSFFEGDYSISQRIAILTTLGLGARELAGFKDEGGIAAASASKDAFPSKMLPERLHKIYADTSPVDVLSKRLERTMMEPMALDAADQLTGPKALKVRTFSSRMEVEKKRTKAIPNELAKIVAQSFFFPLTGRWWTHMQAHGAQNIYFSPILLHTYLKTLALILHASGPSTLSLPQMTSEFWDLLLSVRTNALNDVMVLEAVLFAFLTLLEVNEDKQRLAQEHAKELLETQEWAKLVLERTAGRDEEGGRVRMLAAGVVIRTQEVVEKYQRLMLGDMMDF